MASPEGMWSSCRSCLWIKSQCCLELVLLYSSWRRQQLKEQVTHCVWDTSALMESGHNIYYFCDYNKKGYLIDTFNQSRLQKKLHLLTPFMHCSGKGLWIKEAPVFTLKNSHHDHYHIFDFSPTNHHAAETAVQIEETHQQYSSPSSRMICWKLAFRGVYGENLLHILIICNTEIHTTIAKILINRYPALIHDIFESDEYYGNYI